MLNISLFLMEGIVREFPASDMTRNVGDLLQAASANPVAITKHRKPRFVPMSVEQYETMRTRSPQVAVDVADMPDQLGKLLDKGIEDYLSD